MALNSVITEDIEEGAGATCHIGKLYIEFETSLSGVINRYGITLFDHNNESLIEKYMRMKYSTPEFAAK